MKTLPLLSLLLLGQSAPAFAATIVDTVYQANGNAFVGSIVFHPATNQAVVPPALVTTAAITVTTDAGGHFSQELPASQYTVTVGNSVLFRIAVPDSAGNFTLTELSLDPSWSSPDLEKIFGGTTIIGASTNLILADPSTYGDVSSTTKLWALGPVDPATGLRVTRAYTLDQLGLTGSTLGGKLTGLTASTNLLSTSTSGLTSAGTTTSLTLTLDDLLASGAFVEKTNGLSFSLIAKQAGVGTNWPITIYADGLAGTNNGYSIGNGYVPGGSGGPYPIAFFRPTTPGYSMPFDLMPNGGNADVWMDFCADDITSFAAGGNFGTALNYLDVRHRSIANGNYAEITTDAWGARSFGDLRLQTRASGSAFWVGTYTGIPLALSRHDATQHYFNFDSDDRRFGASTQFRMSSDVNLAWSASGAGVFMRAVKDNGNTTIPVNFVGNPINLTGSNVTLSFDNNWVNRTPQQFRPATGVNLGVSSVGGSAQLTAFDDSNAAIPIVSKATSHAWTTDGGATYGLVFSNNVATATAWATTGGASVGGNLAVSGSASLGSNLALAGGATLGGNLAVSGSSTVASLNIGGTVAATSGRLKITSPTFITADGSGTSYPGLPIQFRPGLNANVAFDASGGGLRESVFNDAAASVPHLHQALSHNFTTDNNATYALTVSNNTVTATTLSATTLSVPGKATLGNLAATTGKIGTPVPSNRSSFSSFENLMANGGNGSALFQTFGGSAGLYVLAGGGTSGSPTPSTPTQITRLAALGLDTAGSTNWWLGATVDLTPTGNWSPTDHGMTAGFSATPSGTTNRIVNVLDTGNAMSIGSSTATTPAASAVLDLQSTTTGFLPPRQTTAQRNAIASPADGLQVANTTDHKGSYYNGTRWYNTPQELAGSATLDFGPIAAGTQADLTLTVTGAQTGDTVALGLPPAPTAGIVWNAFVSATNTVTLRASNISGSPVDPVAALYKVKVFAQ